MTAVDAPDSPPDSMIALVLEAARRSPCRSKRGAVVYATSCGSPIVEGVGFNGPPAGAPCPGREVCAGTCGQRSVHAEVRALRQSGWPRYGGPSTLVHVELASGGGVLACGGPGCWQCSREILDVGFIGGVWLYEAGVQLLTQVLATATPITVQAGAAWRRYTAEEFHRVTLARCGMVP